MPPITMRWLKAHFCIKEKGVNRFAFYGLPESSGKRWATEREYAFRQLVAEEKYRGVVYQGLRNRARELATRAKSAGRLTTNAATANRDYLLPVTDAERGIFCKYVNIYIFPYRKNYA
ncbi:hypothetical protein ACULNC_18570 [Shigella flexneri]